VSVELENELVRLRRALLSMSASAELRVSQAFEALFNRDSGTASAVRDSDREIDEMELDIESECLRILALQHPVASDLRYVLSALRINTELERIADLARGVAKRVIRISSASPVALPESMVQMAAAVRKMLSDALRALASQDEELARQVRRDDAFVDARHKEFYDWAVGQLQRAPDGARAMVDLLFIARAMERIGDLSTNIAEAVIFAAGGGVVRHMRP
jgi:phosphate transport system protein